MKYVAILGRQPALGMAELEQLYGSKNVRWFSDRAAIIDSVAFDFERLGGSLKAGKLIFDDLHGNWLAISRKITSHYGEAWRKRDHKITLGISVYGFDLSASEVQKTGLILKKLLKKNDVSLRLIPNSEAALNTATSHHNKLGLSPNRIELLVLRDKSGRVILAESVGAQNISALAARDQSRPRTDAFVGMLPPKLARMMINFSGTQQSSGALWDPFCGTGTLLQEARMLNIDVYGSDLSQKMVDYTTENMQWLDKRYAVANGGNMGSWHKIFQADATDVKIPSSTPNDISYIVCETYLGQPFSAPPSPKKLVEVRDNCDHIVSQFLRNLHSQINSKTSIVLAVPAWRDALGNFTHIPLVSRLEKLGYQRATLQHVRNDQLLYYRESQIVARELLILRKKA